MHRVLQRTPAPPAQSYIEITPRQRPPDILDVFLECLTETGLGHLDTTTMNTRLASAAAALVLTFGLPATSALAQSYNAPAGIPAAAAPGSRVVGFFDDVTTGSISRRPDDSAKAGNAEQNNKPTANYGTTSGGPAY